MAKEFSDILDDVFDIRDVIARYEELEDQLAEEDPQPDEAPNEDLADDRKEFTAIKSFLEEVKGYGGDEQWRGDWYPVTFICDSYFEDYAREFAEEVGVIDREVRWPYTCIDWEQAASELQQDYSSVEIDGVTYWYR